MPKIIPELRERLVGAARRRILEDGDHDVTIRQVARDCDTAVGTVYNYFPSKEALLTAVMLEDWLICCHRMDEDALAQAAPLEALRATVAALRSFTGRYAPLWRNYESTKDSLGDMNLRHRQVIDAIRGPVSRTLERFGPCRDPHLPEVISELVLLASRTEDGFERVAYALEKILS